MGNVIGIDLGTTNTAVSVVVDGRPKMLEDSHGYKVLPSIVWVGDDGTIKVGQQCKSLLVTEPERTAFAVKRLLGRQFSSPEVADADARTGYAIREAEDGGCLVELTSGTFSPLEISSKVLETAKEMAENALGGPVDEAVITVPAYFNHAQRAATMEAAAKAGLRCERLLNEPTAAALAYGFRKEIDRTLLIFDLGGGTFDVSVLRLSSGVYEILSTLGDTYLGGEDFDHRIVDWLAERFLAETGTDLRNDRITLHRLKEAAERAKCELSFAETTQIQIPYISGDASLDESLDRATLDGLVQDYVKRSLEVSLNAVRDAGLEVGQIDEVILVGGQTRMPAIRSAITDAFGREPSRSVHPEEVVAMGAAVHAASLDVDSELPPAVLIDVTPFDLGIDVAGNMFQPIIGRNSTIPTSASRVFATAKANQATVQVTVRQGSSRVASENEFLGEFVMSGLTPAPRMETKVEVTFKIDTNGMLKVTAMEPATGKQTEITVRNYSEVAQSKGAVKARVDRAPGADPVEDVVAASAMEGSSGTLPPASSSKDSKRGAGAKKAKAPKKPRKAKTKREAKPKDATGGGFLGGLFGRKKKKSATPETPEVKAPDNGGSIIDQVVAEREEAQSSADSIEALPQEALTPESEAGPEAIQLPSIDPTGLEALEPDMDEPAPINIPALEPEALVELGAEALDALDAADLQPIAPEAPDESSAEPVAIPVAAVEESSGSEADFGGDVAPPGLAATEPVDLTPPSGQAPSTDPIPADDEPSADPAPAAEPPPPAVAQADEPTPPPVPEPEPTPSPARKRARLKLGYKNPVSMVREYRSNLAKGGCFIKTPKPLAVGRTVLIEVRVPGIEDNPISIPGEVTWSSRDLETLAPDQKPGMGIEYQLSPDETAAIEARLTALA
ncbi:MAG: Hsp70 family protein [Myxococcota bacterium]|nr:Hsp70 family protein [Myxococcota bacterium]